jgi:hypothetical protein
MRLSPDEQALLEEGLADVVWLWALRFMDHDPLATPSGSALAADQGARCKAELARLAAMEEIGRELDALRTRAAEEAALYGADYADLAEAVEISRAAARKRWPSVAAVVKARRPPSRRNIDEIMRRSRERNEAI